MSGLRRLKETADTSILADIRTTPALKAKLQQRLDQIEKQSGVPDRVERPWLRQVGYLGAAAAILTLALVMGRGAGLGVIDASPTPLHQLLPELSPHEQSNTINFTARDSKGALVSSPGSGTISLKAGALSVVTKDLVANNQVQGSAPQITQPTAAEAQPGRKIITNGEFGLRVQDARSAMDRLQREAIAAGGYVAEATLNKESNGSWLGRVILRMPPAAVATTIQSLGEIGSVERERQWTQDVTEQWMDLENRIAILKEHENQLRGLSEKAATFDDWNKLATQINSTRVEIENLTGHLKLVANQVEFAIINIQVLQPAPGEAAISKSATTFGGQISEAFTNSVLQLNTLARQTVVGLVAIAPFALSLLPMGVIMVLVIRRRRATGPGAG